MTKKSTLLALELRTYSDQCYTHRHDYHQLVLPVQGELDMEISQQGGAVSGTYGALVKADTDHAFAAEGENCFVVMDISPSLSTFPVRLPAWFSLGPTAAEYLRFLSVVLRPSSQFADLTATSRQQMAGLMLQLLAEQSACRFRADARVELVCDYITANLAGVIRLEHLAALANLSPRHLSALFQQALGCTPQQYLLTQRMGRAMTLLQNTNLPVQQVAEQCGYSSLAAFSDRFKRAHGHSPRFFRRR